MKALWEGDWGRADVVAGLALAALGLVILTAIPGIETSFVTDPLGPRFFPLLLAVLLIALSLILVARGAVSGRKRRRRAAAEASASAEGMAGSVPSARPVPEPPAGASRRVMALIFAMGTYVAAVPYIGYGTASVLLFGALLVTAGERRPLRVALQAVTLTLVLVVLFGVILGVELPGGLVPGLRVGY